MARFITEVPMRWSDMDAYRHVNNTAYLAYLEQARIAMFFHRQDGFSDGTVISRHEIEYLRPIVYHRDPLRIETWIGGIGGARFTIRYEVWDGETLAARAATTCVTFDFDSSRPRRLTGEEREVLQAFLDEDQPSAGQPSAGQPSAGQPSAGQPSAGQLSAGQLSAGQLSAGQPSAGQPGVEEPGVEKFGADGA